MAQLTPSSSPRLFQAVRGPSDQAMYDFYKAAELLKLEKWSPFTMAPQWNVIVTDKLL
jgi:hypothetical protein